MYSSSEGGRRGSLYALLHSPSLQLSWAQVAFMVLGAAEGMRHLHAHAVLHRDLKSGACHGLLDLGFYGRRDLLGFYGFRVLRTLNPNLNTPPWPALLPCPACPLFSESFLARGKRLACRGGMRHLHAHAVLHRDLKSGALHQLPASLACPAALFLRSFPCIR